jgi:hypothetical protein
MGVALHSYKIDSDGKIRVRHTFYAPTEADAEALKIMHAGGCKAYGPAVRAEETIDVLVEDVEPPTEEDAEEYDGDIADDAADDDDDADEGGEG